MVSSCSAHGCTNRQKGNDTRRFHRFPVNSALLKKWIVSMRRLTWSPGSSARLCSDHFTSDCYDRSKPWLNKLKPDAVPTIFNFPAHLIPETENWCWSMPVPDPLPAYRMPILHWACYLGKVNIVKYMLRCGVHGSNGRAVALPPSERVINTQLLQRDSAGGNTPIHLCCEMLANSGKEVINRGNKYIRCLDQLLYFTTAHQQESNGPDGLQLAKVINIQNASGDTPLHIVSRSDKLHSVVRQLLIAGADCNIVSSGSTALDIARECRNIQIINILTHANDALGDEEEDEMSGSSNENTHLLPVSVMNELSLQETLSRFGLTVSSECDSAELERCFALLQQSNDVTLIETVRRAVIDNLEQLEKHKEYLSAKMEDVESESTALEIRHQSDVQYVAQLKTKLDSSIKERRLLAKKARRAHHRVESMRAKRDSIAQMLSELKVPRR